MQALENYVTACRLFLFHSLYACHGLTGMSWGLLPDLQYAPHSGQFFKFNFLIKSRASVNVRH